jgi:hypothetical protein
MKAIASVSDMQAIQRLLANHFGMGVQRDGRFMVSLGGSGEWLDATDWTLGQFMTFLGY